MPEKQRLQSANQQVFRKRCEPQIQSGIILVDLLLIRMKHLLLLQVIHPEKLWDYMGGIARLWRKREMRNEKEKEKPQRNESEKRVGGYLLHVIFMFRLACGKYRQGKNKEHRKETGASAKESLPGIDSVRYG